MRGRNASRVERPSNFIFVLFVPFVVFFWFITPRSTWRWHRPQPSLMPETEIRSCTCDRRGDSLNVVLLPDCVTIPPQ